MVGFSIFRSDYIQLVTRGRTANYKAYYAMRASLPVFFIFTTVLVILALLLKLWFCEPQSVTECKTVTDSL